MGRYSYTCALELAVIKEAQAGRQEGDHGRGLVLRPGEFGRGARLVVVFEKADELVLIVEAGEQVATDRRDIALSQAVVESLVVAIIEALLVQRPFEVPIDLGHKSEGGILSAHCCRRFRPERLG